MVQEGCKACVCQPRTLLPSVRSLHAVRNRAMEVLGKCHAQLGPSLVDFLEGLKPAQLMALEEHFRQNPKTQVGRAEWSPHGRVDMQRSGPRYTAHKRRWMFSFSERRCALAAQQVVPTRTVRTKSKKAAAAGADATAAGAAEVEEEGPAELDPEDLLPRADIGGSITPSLLSMISSSNWKERNAGVDQVGRRQGPAEGARPHSWLPHPTGAHRPGLASLCNCRVALAPSRLPVTRCAACELCR